LRIGRPAKRLTGLREPKLNYDKKTVICKHVASDVSLLGLVGVSPFALLKWLIHPANDGLATKTVIPYANGVPAFLFLPKQITWGFPL